MGKLGKVLIITIISVLLYSFNHEYYVSIANIYVNNKNNQFEIELKIDSEDLEKVLFKESGKKINLEENNEQNLDIIGSYISKNFIFNINGGKKTTKLLGVELNSDGSFWCYIVVDLPETIKNLKIKNTLLMPTFIQQHNIVNIKLNKKTYSHTYIHNHTFHTFKLDDK